MQAAALDALWILRDPFCVLNSAEFWDLDADQNRRVMVFVADLTLNLGETESGVQAARLLQIGRTFPVSTT